MQGSMQKENHKSNSCACLDQYAWGLCNRLDELDLSGKLKRLQIMTCHLVD